MKKIRVKNYYNLELTADEYEDMRGEYDGFCTNCGAVTYGECEPDMREGYCESCDNQTVMGIEELLIEGKIRING